MSTNYGRCDCGSIEYEFQDDPINTVFCYCKTCQLHTNSDKWFGVWVPLINLNLLKAPLQVLQQLATQGKKHIVYFVGIVLLQLVSSVTVLIYILCLPARSKEVKHYGLKCLSTPLLPLIGLLFLKEFQNMTLSRPADKYLINPFLKV